jgi:methylmalonyl-CoA mutase
MTGPYSNFKPFCIKTSRYTESGGNPLESLGLGLGGLIELIDSLDIDPKVIFSKVFLEASVAENHFGEIARLKAFRMAFLQLAGVYSVELKEEEVFLFCKTAQWSKSLLDANTNLIRQTYEAMSAVLGGANWLWVQPMQEEHCSEMERRIARNVSSILREESYLDKVMDPAAGAFFLENLKEDVLAQLKNQLSKMEASGGWLKALERGEIHFSVRQQREKIQNQVIQNQLIKIGSNKYPAPAKHSTDLVWEVFKEKIHELNPTRATYLIELQTLGES